MLSTFMNKFNDAVERFVPKSKSRSSKGNVSLRKETLRNIRRKHRLWERYMEKRSKESYREFCKARNKVKKLIRKERKEKEREIAETAKTNSKNFWKYVNSKRKTKSGVSALHTKKDNLTCIASKDNQKAEVLADFFSSVFTSETDSNIPELENLSVNETSSDELFSIDEVRKLLLGLNTTKSP